MGKITSTFTAKELNPSHYPRFMRHNASKKIILETSPGAGVVIYTEAPRDYSIGDYLDSWSTVAKPSDWTEFKGEVTLKIT